MKDFVCLDCSKDTIHSDYYMINDDLWHKLVPEDDKEKKWEENPELLIFEKHFLCIKCLQKRLGRKLNKNDFTPYQHLEINQEVFKHHKIN